MIKMSHFMNGFAATVLVLGSAASVLAADQKQDPQRNVNRVLGAQPPRESTGTARSSVLTSTRSVRISDLRTPPPPPPKHDRNNPTGDKHVQKGFDDHQKAHKAQH